MAPLVAMVQPPGEHNGESVYALSPNGKNPLFYHPGSRYLIPSVFGQPNPLKIFYHQNP